MGKMLIKFSVMDHNSEWIRIFLLWIIIQNGYGSGKYFDFRKEDNGRRENEILLKCILNNLHLTCDVDVK